MLRPRPRGVEVRCDHPLVPTDATNLAARAAEALRAYGRVSAGVEIEITKRIPVAGGLGGGSSNAAAVLLGLDRLWKLGLGPDGLHPLARRLGADVPFFLLGGTALGLSPGGRGLPPAPAGPGPRRRRGPRRPRLDRRGSSPARRGFDTPRNSNSIFSLYRGTWREPARSRVLANDLEEAALEEAPALREQAGRIRAVLLREGARLAALSGSGASYFGLFEGARPAERARRALVGEGFRALVARTLTLDQYRVAWGRARAR